MKRRVSTAVVSRYGFPNIIFAKELSRPLSQKAEFYILFSQSDVVVALNMFGKMTLSSFISYASCGGVFLREWSKIFHVPLKEHGIVC